MDFINAGLFSQTHEIFNKYSGGPFYESPHVSIYLKFPYIFLLNFRENQNKVGVAIGFGFFLECSYEEAFKIIAKKKAALAQKITETEEKLAQVHANIQIVFPKINFSFISYNF